MSIIYETSIYGGYSDTATSTYGGEIQIEQDRWQLITIPVTYGYWNSSYHQIISDGQTLATIKNYLFDQVTDIMHNPAQNYITSAHTYIGDNNFFYNYVAGVTNPLSIHNFPLAYIDEGRVEYVAFWIRSIHSAPIIIKWGE